MVRNANYFIGEAFTGIFRNKLMSASSVAIIASCIFIVVFVICLVLNVSHIFRQSEASTGITVFLELDITEEQTDILRERIRDIEHVASIVYVSAEEGLEGMIDDGHTGAIRFRGEGNPLPASFEIELSNTRQANTVYAALNALTDYGIYSIRFLDDILNIFVVVNNFIVALSIVIILVLGGLSVLIVVNTIKLTVNNRKNEISIMKYVGATDAFVRWPFIMEGLLIGLAGAALPVLIAVLGYNSAVNAVHNNLPFLGFLTLRSAGEIFPLLAPLALLIGATIGVAGSVLSLRKYLKV